jgi:hypothetical protein
MKRSNEYWEYLWPLAGVLAIVIGFLIAGVVGAILVSNGFQ